MRPFCVAVRSVMPLPEGFLQERTLHSASARGAARAGFFRTNSCFGAQRQAKSAAFFVRTEANKVVTVLVEGGVAAWGSKIPQPKLLEGPEQQQKPPPWPKAPRIRFARQIPKAPGKGRCFQEVGSSKLFVVLQRFKPFRAKGEEFSNTTTQRSRDLQEFHFSKVRRAASIGFAFMFPDVNNQGNLCGDSRLQGGGNW